MIHLRRPLRSILLGVVGAAALLPAQAATAADLVPITASVRCGTYDPVTFKISAKVPAQTAPGQPVALTDVAVVTDFDYPFTQLPTSPEFVPTAAYVDLDAATVSVLGAAETSVSLTGLPASFPRTTTTGGFQTRFTTPAVVVGDSTPAATSGTTPVVLRIASIDYRLGWDFGRGAPVTKNARTCTPNVADAGLAVVPSTGPVPSAPVIESLSPAVASVEGGDTVTIKGQGFATATALLVDGNRTYFTWKVIDDETIRFTAPVSDLRWGGDTVELQVRTSYGTSGKTLFSWGGPRLPVPTITSVSPNRIPITAGTAAIRLVVTGSGFDRLGVDSTVNLGNGSREDDIYNGVAIVESVSPDGTSMGLRIDRYGNAFLPGISNLVFSLPGACETADCRTADTPGDDITFFDPTAATPSPSPSPVPAIAFAVKGSAALKTLTKGSVPLSGSLTGVSLQSGTGAFGGALALDPTAANLTALGLLPVKAQLAFVPTERVTGTLDGNGLSLTAKLRIKLPKVSVFGIELAGGSNCQAKQITSVPLRSTGTFDAAGGALAGTFSISDLSGCGALTGIVSSLTSGGGNAIAVALSPKV